MSQLANDIGYARLPEPLPVLTEESVGFIEIAEVEPAVGDPVRGKFPQNLLTTEFLFF